MIDNFNRVAKRAVKTEKLLISDPPEKHIPLKHYHLYRCFHEGDNNVWVCKECGNRVVTKATSLREA